MQRHFSLSTEDFALINPNTRTCPIFRSRRDAELTKAIYTRVPVLVNEEAGEAGNPWGISFMAMFHMANDSGLFRTREQLEEDGWRLEGNVFVKGAERYLPLYEAKMVSFFDHRAADVVLSPRAITRQHQPEYLDDTAHSNPQRLAMPNSWVSAEAVEERLRGRWARGWLLGWADITSATNARTVIASIIPRTAAGDTFLLALPATDARSVACLLANLDSFVLDYIARQKFGGTHLKYHVLKQLALHAPRAYADPTPWDSRVPLAAWIASRVLELV
jgi:hypothetical protein